MTIPLEVFAALPDPVVILDRAWIRWVNRRFAELAGTEPEALVGRATGEVFCPLDRDRLFGLLEAEPAKLGGLLRVGFRSEHVGPRALDFRVAEAGPGVLLLSGRDDSDSERTRDTVTQLSQLFLSQGGRAMVDLDALLDASRPVFERLGWLVVVFEIQAASASIRCVLRPSRLASVDPELPPATARDVPLDLLPGMRRMLQSRVGFFDDQPLDSEGGMAGWATATGRDPTALASFLAHQGLTRGAWVPCVVRDQVPYVVGAMSRDLVRADFAAVQLFASQISAAVQISELTAEIGKQQKLAALGQMSGLLAHEVRNPLAVMFQAYRQLRRRVGDKVEIGDLMDMVEEEAWRLSHLVDDLVHFAGPIKPRLQEVGLGQIVTWALDGLSADADAPTDKIDIHVDVPSELPAVLADPMLLRQAISHLVANACAHVRRGGNVWISGEDEPVGRRVRLTVMNDGEPLPPDVAYRVFEPFFTTKPKGTGLGLAVVRRLVEDQKGKVVLDTTEQGVSFSVWLPAASAPPSP